MTTTVTVMELRVGIEHLLESSGGDSWTRTLSRALDDLLGGRVS